MTVLAILSGLAWTIVYVDCIRVGFRERTYAMPVAALALNIAWESIYAVHGLATTVTAQTVIDLVWTLADVLIVVTFIRFGRGEFPAGLPVPAFAVGAGVLFAAAYAVQGLFLAEFGRDDAATYSAFLQNVLMSGLFIAMFLARRGSRGQTVTIAVAKWLGTLAATVAFGVVEPSAFVLGLGLLCCLLDVAYLGLLLWTRDRPGILQRPLAER